MLLVLLDLWDIIVKINEVKVIYKWHMGSVVLGEIALGMTQ